MGDGYLGSLGCRQGEGYGACIDFVGDGKSRATAPSGGLELSGRIGRGEVAH